MKPNPLQDLVGAFESAEVGRRFLPNIPIVVRLDGKGFSKWTKDLKRPYDERLSQLMIDTAKFLAVESNAVVAFTQSDEISLILYTDQVDSQVYFDGRIQKLTSILAAQATAYFNDEARTRIPGKALAYFDCRAFSVPDKDTAVKALMVRESDGIRNSINNAGRTYFSHSFMQKKTTTEIRTSMIEQGIDWSVYPAFYKYGTYILKKTEFTKYSADELSKLGPKHHAKTNPDLLVERSIFKTNHDLGWASLLRVEDPIKEIFG